MNPAAKSAVVRAALSRDPSRAGDQVLWWSIKIVKELGFPIFVGVWLLLSLPNALARLLDRENERRAEVTKALVEAIGAHTRAVEQLHSDVDENTRAVVETRAILLGGHANQAHEGKGKP